MDITEEFIVHFTGNSSTVSNGRSLAKTSYVGLFESADGSLVFGDCTGSGKNPYRCSVDFSDPDKPVPRCNCPSRQTPCKHTVGLLFCKLQKKAFTVQDVPEDIAAKRNRVQAKEAKKEAAESGDAAAAAPKKAVSDKAKYTASLKKCKVQLEGIALAEKILHNIVLSGLHGIEDTASYEKQAKELGNYYINGIQAGLNDLLITLEDRNGEDFTKPVADVNYLYSLLKRSRSHTESKIALYEAHVAAASAKKPEDAPPIPAELAESVKEAVIHSSIEEQMGYAWKLAELHAEGLFVENARLMQVGFSVTPNEAKKQDEDEGVWLSLTDKRIYLTKNYRPFKAQKKGYVKAEDSAFSLLELSELSVYPGDKNPRVRWEGTPVGREISASDYAAAQQLGEADFAAVIKAVKNQIKNPLADKNPVFALKIARLDTDPEGNIVVFDEKGTGITVSHTTDSQAAFLKSEANFGFLLKRVSREQAVGNTLVARFNQDIKSGLLAAIPIALVTAEDVLRFTF